LNWAVVLHKYFVAGNLTDPLIRHITSNSLFPFSWISVSVKSPVACNSLILFILAETPPHFNLALHCSMKSTPGSCACLVPELYWYFQCLCDCSVYTPCLEILFSLNTNIIFFPFSLNLKKKIKNKKNLRKKKI